MRRREGDTWTIRGIVPGRLLIDREIILNGLLTVREIVLNGLLIVREIVLDGSLIVRESVQNGMFPRTVLTGCSHGSSRIIVTEYFRA
jgi:hypothetical protein